MIQGSDPTQFSFKVTLENFLLPPRAPGQTTSKRMNGYTYKNFKFDCLNTMPPLFISYDLWVLDLDFIVKVLWMICFGKEVRFAQQCFSNIGNVELCDADLVTYVALATSNQCSNTCSNCSGEREITQLLLYKGVIERLLCKEEFID